MEHFDIILPLARLAVDRDPVRGKHHVKQLRDKLGQENPDQAAKLDRLLRPERGQNPIAVEEA